MSKGDTGSTLGSLWMVLASLSFALMLVFIKIAGTRFGMHAYELTFWRVAISVMVLGGHAFLMGRNFSTHYPKEHFWRSLSGTIALIINFYVVVHLPIATASTLQNTSALFLGLLSFLILKQKPSLSHWLALLLGFIGVVLLLKPSLVDGQLPTMGLGLLSGAISGYAYLQVRELSLLGEPAWRIVFYFALLASVISGILAAWVGFSPITLESLPWILAIGISALLGQLLMTYAYQIGRKFMVATLSYLVVAFALLFGVLVFDETLDTQVLLAIAIIVSGGILSSKRS